MTNIFKRLRAKIENTAAFALGAGVGIVVEAVEKRNAKNKKEGTVSFATYESVRAQWQRAHDALRGIDLLVERARVSGTLVVTASELDKLIRQGLGVPPTVYEQGGVAENLVGTHTGRYRGQA